MTKGELLRNAYKYMCCSIIAWDNPDRKCEDDPRNNVYFFSNEYKKKFCQPVEKIRKMGKIQYFENKSTSTNFNVIEIGDEVIFAFRGSDSKQDWLADFDFFKVKYQNAKNYINEILKPEMSEEDYNLAIIEEIMKGTESFDVPDFLRNSFFVSPFKNIFSGKNSFSAIVSNLSKNKNDNKIESFSDLKDGENRNFLLNAIEKTKDIVFHRGFFNQFNSIVDQVEEQFEKYADSKKKIVFTGHSLGSPLAKLAWLVSIMKKPEVFNKTFCYIFGTPKIGNKSVNDLFTILGKNDKLVITNIENDLVKSVPPENFGYPAPKDNIRIKAIPAPFKTKFNHTLFYYLYCFKNQAPVEFDKK